MRRIGPGFALLIALLAARPAAAQDVMAAIRAERWADATIAAARIADPVAGKLVTYYRLLTPGAATVGEITEFMAGSPDWPLQSTLARRRDQALAGEPDDAAAAAECDRGKPFAVAAPDALVRCAEALATLGRAADGAAMARRAWVAAPADAAWEARFLQRWAPALGPADQWARFDRLAWNDAAGAQRQIARLDAADRPRADARLALKRDDPAAATLLAALPDPDRAAPAMMLEQARWLRRGDADDEALALWQAAGSAAELAAPPEHRAAFWTERDILARRRLRQGDAVGAYALAAAGADIGGASAMEAEFLAGFVALRKLGAPDVALPHFRALAAASPAAITQSRAHFWLAKTLAAQGDASAAQAEYTAAASYPATFYGQLAALALGETPEQRIAATADPPADTGHALDFAGRELARGAAWLVAWGEPQRAESFLLRLDDVTPDAADRTLAGRLAIGFGLPEVAITLARRAGRDGVTLLQTGWPVAARIPPDAGVEPALALAVIRQESSFDGTTISGAGARGLMQLMPGTATLVARRLGLHAPVAALTADARLNIRLGTAYLGELLAAFGGSVPLAVAAYNAGPSRVEGWLAGNGDPRAGGTDMLDWIEQIPFAETRNYVQRVIENLMVYRSQRGDAAADPVRPAPA
jgi:soluble lytic murein transglycosylase